jgi:hypothetical protein
MSRETSTIYIHPHNVMVFMNVQGACPFWTMIGLGRPKRPVHCAL